MTEPFGDIYYQGPRPSIEPTDCGEWRPFSVYAMGDTVNWNGEKYRALRDYRSGSYPPDLVYADYPDTVWARLQHELGKD